MSYEIQNQLELYTENPQVHTSLCTLEKIPTLLQFTQDNFTRIWEEGSHQKESLAKIVRLSSYADNEFRPITAYRPSHIYTFLDHRSEVYGNAAGTLNRYIACLSKIFRFYEDEFNLSNVTPRLRYRRDPSMRGRPRVFTPHEQSQMLEMLSNSEYPWAAHIVAFSLLTGMRKGEILGIGRLKSEVKTNATYGKVIEEDGEYSVHLFDTKNGEEREVWLNAEAYKHLKALDFRPSDAFDHHQFYRVWDRMRNKLARNDPHFVFHVCRHTAATALASTGLNTVQIGQVLGHKAIQTTAKYIKPDRKQAKQMMQYLTLPNK